MDKKFFEFLKEAPTKTGVHTSWGEVAILIVNAEIEKSKDNETNPFSSDKFISQRERAKFLFPGGHAYTTENKIAYEKCLDIGEYSILNHEKQTHGIDNSERLKELETIMSKEDIELASLGFWML